MEVQSEMKEWNSFKLILGQKGSWALSDGSQRWTGCRTAGAVPLGCLFTLSYTPLAPRLSLFRREWNW